MKEENLNLVREAGIYSVQINSTQDITSTYKRSVILRLFYVYSTFILRFVSENVKERLFGVVRSHSANAAELCNLLIEVLQKQNIDISKCNSDSIDGPSNMSGQYNGFTAFLEKDLLVTFTHGAILTFSTWFSVMFSYHASISLLE